jgi:transposase-like protein
MPDGWAVYDVAAAKRFFREAMKNNGAPRTITLDHYAPSHRAIVELKAERTMTPCVRVRSSNYLNNGIEQDHRRVKQRIRPMLGFKRFQAAAVTISEIELAAKSGSTNSRSASCPAVRPQFRQSGQA